MKVTGYTRHCLATQRERRRMQATHEFIDIDPFRRHLWDAVEDVRISIDNGVWIKWKVGSRWETYREDLRKDIEKFMGKRPTEKSS